jgi:hypothetical protein
MEMNGATHGIRAAALAATLALAVAQTAVAAITPAQKCEGGKTHASGKYAACLAKAEKAYITTGDASKYGPALVKCEMKMDLAYDKLEFGAVTAGGSCPTNSDVPAIENFVEACNASIATAVGGGTLGPNPLSCEADLDACQDDYSSCYDDNYDCDLGLAGCEDDLADAGPDLASCEDELGECLAADGRILPTGQLQCWNDAGTVIACAGSGRDGEHRAGFTPHFVDNGDGTISDYVSGLMWEKLSDDGSIHDKDTLFLGLSAGIAKATSLNGMSFAGYTDWRVPNIRELGTLPDYEYFNMAIPPIFRTGCTPGCNVLTCSCTKSNVYMSSTVYLGHTPAIWTYNMTDGDMYAQETATASLHVRAVRTMP